MKEYILAAYEKKSLLLDLNQIKELHSSYLLELNLKLFQAQPLPMAQSPEQVTQLLFGSEEYIIQWVEHNLSWQALKSIINPFKMSYQQWKDAEKKILLK